MRSSFSKPQHSLASYLLSNAMPTNVWSLVGLLHDKTSRNPHNPKKRRMKNSIDGTAVNGVGGGFFWCVVSL
jgi:hypothetical protein